LGVDFALMAVVTVALDSEPLLLLGSGSKVVDRLPLWLVPLAKIAIAGKSIAPVAGL
jgi:hypothetical protein